MRVFHVCRWSNLTGVSCDANLWGHHEFTLHIIVARWTHVSTVQLTLLILSVTSDSLPMRSYIDCREDLALQMRNAKKAVLIIVRLRSDHFLRSAMCVPRVDGVKRKFLSHFRFITTCSVAELEDFAVHFPRILAVLYKLTSHLVRTTE